MLTGLLIILILVLTLPFLVKLVEHNLEIFLFIMGLAATIVSGVLSWELAAEIFKNRFLYMITAAVLVAGLLFRAFKHRVKDIIDIVLKYIPLKVLIFLIIVILGLASSFITAIIASLLLVEIVYVLPLSRKNKINLDIIACFSIGLGAALTPVGEPLSTITVSRLNTDFWYLLRGVGPFIIPGILVIGLFGAYYVKSSHAGKKARVHELHKPEHILQEALIPDAEKEIDEDESYLDVVFRAIKVFVFVLALELLGSGFKPVIDTYVILLSSPLLYWLNMISSILDNATLAAAEISIKMTSSQIQAILMGLLISGGMLIPGNIPNIISAGKLKIRSKEWAKLGIPLGLAIMAIYYIIIFILI